MYSFIDNSYFFKIPQQSTIPRTRKFLLIVQKSTNNEYVCRMCTSKQQSFISIGTSIQNTAPVQDKEFLFQDSEISVFELNSTEPAQPPTVIVQQKVPSQDVFRQLVTDLPVTPSCTVNLRCFTFKVFSSATHSLQDFTLVFKKFPLSTPKCTPAYFGAFPPLQQLVSYLKNARGGVSISGPGKNELIDFALTSLNLKPFEFRIQTTTSEPKSILSNFQTIHLQTEPNFGKVFNAEADALVFKDINLKTRTGTESDILTTQIIKQLDDNTVKEYQEKLGFAFIAACEQQEDLDPALRRNGRFGVEIRLPYLNADIRRKWIVMSMFSSQNSCESLEQYMKQIDAEYIQYNEIIAENKCNEILDTIVANCNGYDVPEIRNAVFQTLSIHPNIQTASLNQQNLAQIFETLAFQLKIQPYKQPELELIEKTDQSINDFPTLKTQYDQIIQNFNLNNNQLAQQLNLHPQHVLITGESGSGKTLLTQLLRNSHNFSFYRIDSTNIYSQYVGESEQNLRRVFAKARQSSPSVLVFENLDFLIGHKRKADEENDVAGRVLAQFLTELDGVGQQNKDVFCIGTSCSEASELDSAIVRFKRFGLQVKCEMHKRE
ncbi:AAA_family ATPase [Hexamita inflata]|uniref:CDC48 subfamily n=1 Tax=Hexamita inflata TaxID=28002 RepID=A0AA86PE55_9EUKA|nr:AAA family ATPase [Hexamita inflata]